jgi:hypothetical protein
MHTVKLYPSFFIVLKEVLVSYVCKNMLNSLLSPLYVVIHSLYQLLTYTVATYFLGHMWFVCTATSVKTVSLTLEDDAHFYLSFHH